MKSLLIVLMLTTTLPAMEYFVATNGNDNQAGTRNQPFRTIARGLAAARMPGDEVIVRKGIYRPARSLQLNNAGAEGKYITLRACEGENPIIDGTNTPKDTNLVNVATHHVRIKGMTIRNSKRTGIAVWGPGSRVHHVEVLGNEIHHCFFGGAFAGFNNQTDPVRDILFEDNTIHHNVQKNKQSPRKAWDAGLGGGAMSKNVTIRNNTVFENYGEGIVLYLSDSGVIEGNEVHDNFSVNIYLDNATNCRVRRNLIYSTGDDDFFRSKHPADGILIANESYGPNSNPSYHNEITNNIMIGNRSAFCYGAYQRGGGLRDTLFANNTAYRSTGALLRIDVDDGHKNSQFVNNIFQQVGRVAMTDIRAKLDGIEFKTNLWSGPRPQQPARSAGDVFADPLFVNTGSKVAKDYQLRNNSPALNVGAKITENSPNFGGRPRSGKINLGAW